MRGFLYKDKAMADLKFKLNLTKCELYGLLNIFKPEDLSESDRKILYELKSDPAVCEAEKADNEKDR